MIKLESVPFLNRKILGKKIKDARRAKNLSQRDLATLVGSSESYISRIEIGDCKCNLEILTAICKSLDISIIYTLDGTFVYEKNYLKRELNLLLDKLSTEEKEKVYEYTKELVKTHVKDVAKTKLKN